MDSKSRRDFIKNTAKAAGFIPLSLNHIPSLFAKNPKDGLHISIFSKHLQFLNYKEMAQFAADIGFDGVDLTVRPKGHVLPENVKQDLPKAVDALSMAGFDPVMMTTAVDSASNPIHQNVLQTAAKLGIEFYRMGYFRYPKDLTIPEAVMGFQKEAELLGQFNDKLGLTGCYQNHAGNYVGASMYELYDIFSDASRQSTGIQYDIRHATVEGGKSWETGLRLVEPIIKTIVLKDFRWEKRDGVWDTINTPLGEGMVDFNKYFGLLKKYQINVPVSMHFEYPMGGAEHGDREISVKPDHVFEVMHKDLEFARKIWAAS